MSKEQLKNTEKAKHVYNGKKRYMTQKAKTAMETKFYYIVGEYRFVMIQASRFNDSYDIYKVSDHIVESFVWNEK